MTMMVPAAPAAPATPAVTSATGRGAPDRGFAAVLDGQRPATGGLGRGRGDGPAADVTDETAAAEAGRAEAEGDGIELEVAAFERGLAALMAAVLGRPLSGSSATVVGATGQPEGATELAEEVAGSAGSAGADAGSGDPDVADGSGELPVAGRDGGVEDGAPAGDVAGDAVAGGSGEGGDVEPEVASQPLTGTGRVSAGVARADAEGDHAAGVAAGGRPVPRQATGIDGATPADPAGDDPPVTELPGVNATRATPRSGPADATEPLGAMTTPAATRPAAAPAAGDGGELPTAPAPVASAAEGAAPAADARRAGAALPSPAVTRVLDAIERLEQGPPPRVMVIESGEARLRIGIEAGVVRIAVLGPRTEATDAVLRETAQALDARGLDADVEGDPTGRQGRSEDQPERDGLEASVPRGGSQTDPAATGAPGPRAATSPRELRL